MVLQPMKAASGSLPLGEDWVYELKWDGMRLLATVADGNVRLITTNGRDATVRFPELQPLADALDTDVVLDGEVVAFGANGLPSFGKLQERMHIGDAETARRKAAEVPVMFLIFDVLRVDGSDTIALSWSERRRILEEVVPAGPAWQVPAVYDDGEALLELATNRGMEGVMAKRRTSTYDSGRRSQAWRKVKVRRVQEFVVGGWAPGEKTAALSSLAVGYYDQGTLVFAGRVGSGLGGASVRLLTDLLAGTERTDCPFDPPPPRAMVREVRWVEPTVVVQVAFAEWTGDGRLRHPSYLGVRDDVEPANVVREPTPDA